MELGCEFTSTDTKSATLYYDFIDSLFAIGFEEVGVC